MTSRQFQCRPFERQGGIGYRWPAISTGRNLCCRRGVTRHAFRSISVQQHHLLKVKNQQQGVIRSNAHWISSRPISFQWLRDFPELFRGGANHVANLADQQIYGASMA